MHQINRRLIKANRRVIDRRPADLEQLALARQAQIGILFADHLAAFDGLIASALVTKNHSPPPADQSWREAP